ncbi:MAG: Stp1/IreP family PP2C-type Ser/Thr phosphatase [Peptococcaceae bacterium]|jgi:protein phosphatase|nr:Stp1/IreP family PP2C-type Ser/Thr phosphatase [Peptococcaceae bacterium]
MRVLSFSETGAIRKKNEDRLLALPEYGLFAVADGMGGERAGEVAAQMALDYLNDRAGQLAAISEEKIEAWFVETFNAANQEILALARQDANKEGMGTTLTALLIREKMAVVAHVGDSRAYIWRKKQLLLLTEDHSLVGELLRLGEITEEEADVHPRKHILVRAIGVEQGVKVDTRRFDVQEKDAFLLCTDGVSNSLSHAELAEKLDSFEPKEEFMERLKDVIWERGAKDNFTALFCKME